MGRSRSPPGDLLAAEPTACCLGTIRWSASFWPDIARVWSTTPAPIGRPDTTRVRPFDPAGRTFALVPFQGDTAEALAELRKASDPFEGATVSEHDPLSFQQTYVNRLRRLIPEVERFPFGLVTWEDFLGH